MKTFEQYIAEGASIYCPNCGENHGKASEYSANHGGAKSVQFCGTCGYSAKKSSNASGKRPLHMHQDLSADGKESGMHDARKTFPSEQHAREHVANIVKLNPGKKIRYNLHVNGEHKGIIGS